MDNPQVELGILRQEPACGPGLLFPLLGQIDVEPAGEEILGVPEGLAVADEHQFGHGSSVSRAYRPLPLR